MRGFPTILSPYDTQPLFMDDSSMFALPQGEAIFYSLHDGEWTDRAMWGTVGNSGNLPGKNDTVYIRHNVTLKASVSVNNFCKNIFISGTLLPFNDFGFGGLTVYNKIEGNGTIDTSGVSSGFQLTVMAYRANFSGRIIGGTGTVYYGISSNQYLMPCYHGISVVIDGGLYKKYLRADTYMYTLQVRKLITIELGIYNLVVGGTTVLNNVTQSAFILLSKNGYGSIVFGGSLGCPNNIKGVDFSGNPDVECQNGIGRANDQQYSRFGYGTWRFTTNNQSVLETGSGQYYLTNFYGKVIIDNIILTANNLIFNDTLDGTTSGSTFTSIQYASPATIVGNRIYYRATTQPMVTGILDATAANQIWYYDKAGAQEIRGGTYANLTLGGSGSKKLMGNVVVTGTYTLTGSATLDLNGYTRT